MFATQVLPENLSDDDSDSGNPSELVGFIIVNGRNYEVKKGENKIGRDSSLCSIVIENFTISKIHAVIESDGRDDTFIYDVGSTNQTKLGKKVLKPHCRYKLDNESKVTLGNVTAKFVLPTDKSLSANLETKLINLGPLEELGDIFDVATQVTAPKVSDKVAVFEKIPENLHVFKIPNSTVPEKTKESPGSSKICFNDPIQCRLDSPLRVEYRNSSLESSSIFSLNTECQLYEPRNETNKLKSLLNDGQDEVLSNFMSLHSMKAVKYDIKNKTKIDNSNNVFDESTQGQIKENKSKLNSNKNIKEFSRISCGPTITTSTPVRCRIKSPIKATENSNSTEQIKEEDFIKTQDFNVEALESTNNALRDKQTHPSFDESLSSSAIEQDLILTQTFEAAEPNNHNRETNFVIPETEDWIVDDDFMETQVYDVEKEKQQMDDIQNSKNRSPISHEDHNQGNSEDDFIATQAYSAQEEKSAAASSFQPDKEESPLNRTQINNEDDSIATQLYDAVRENQRMRKKITAAPSALANPELYLESTQRNEKDDLTATQVFNNERDKFVAVPLFQLEKPEFRSDCTQRNSENDFIETQVYDVQEEKSVAAAALSFKFDNPEPLLECTQRNNEDDFIATQDFEHSRNEREDQDFIATQPVDFMKKTMNFRKAETSRESSPDLLCVGTNRKNSEDYVNTQMFEAPDGRNPQTPKRENLDVSCVKKENEIVSQTVESSGDETESDLEIILDKTEIKKYRETNENFFQAELETEKNMDLQENDNNSYVFELEPQAQEKTSNVQPNEQRPGDLSDSDATDCEEVAMMSPKILINQGLPNKVEFEDAQILPRDFTGKIHNSNDDCYMVDPTESPKFELENEPWSPLSLEMPNTQEIETTLNGAFRKEEEKLNEEFANPPKMKKLEVGNSKIEPAKEQIDSRLKRPMETVEVVPFKKTKIEPFDCLAKKSSVTNSEKQLMKLVQAHDIAQIQQGKTRSSLRNLASEKKADILLVKTNERETSRRKTNPKRGSVKKINCDITPYLIKKTDTGGRKKQTSPKENQSELNRCSRTLRRSRRKSGDGVLVESPERNIPVRRSRRTKSLDYFSGRSVNVIFTGFNSEPLEKIIADLGGERTNDLSSGEVVVADKVRRTVKFLCAIGLSLPIASPQWLLSCKKEKRFLNPWSFILKDEKAEEKWEFELKSALERSKKGKLLLGFCVFATRSAEPPVKDLMAVVECCGGTPLLDPPNVWPRNTIVLSCLEDKKWWPPSKLRSVKLVHYEFILSGVLRQKLDFKTYKLR